MPTPVIAWDARSRRVGCGPTAITSILRMPRSAVTSSPVSVAKTIARCSIITSRPRICWSRTAPKRLGSSRLRVLLLRLLLGPDASAFGPSFFLERAMNVITRVDATPAALELIARLLAKHGALMFHQSGGCCDGSSPMCYPVGELLVGVSDVKLGDIGGAAFYMGGAQFESRKHTDLTI